MIAAFKKRPAWLAVPAVFTLLAVGVCTLTSAQTPVIRAPNRDMPAAPLLPVVTAAATSPEEAARVATKMAALQQQQVVVQAQLDAMSNIGPGIRHEKEPGGTTTKAGGRNKRSADLRSPLPITPRCPRPLRPYP